MQTSTPDNGLWLFRCKAEQTIAIDDLEPLPYKPNGFESTTDETLYLSIKSIGLQDPFVIATRPNDCKYTLIAGGNSRLRALHQLRSETGDERFSRVPCLIAEWPGIFQACLAHIITNDVRINRSFLDRARSLTHIVETHGHKAKGREISQRDAVAMLSENGYPISQAAYSYMVYLVQRLTSHLADELLEQLGLADVRQVRELENRMNEQVCRKGIPGHEFTAIFDRALAMTDRSIWEFDIFLTQVDQNVSSQLNEHVRRLSDSAQIERTGVEYELPQNGVTTETDLPRVELGHAPNSQYKDWEESDRERGDATTGFASKSELPICVDAFELTSSKVRHLRNSSYKLALKLCQGLSIDEACITKSTTGCGFRLDGGLFTELEPLQQETLAYLDAFSEITDSSGQVTSLGGSAIDSESKSGVPTNEPVSKSGSRHVSAGLWIELEDHNWYTLMELWDLVRLLRSKKVWQST